MARGRQRRRVHPWIKRNALLAGGFIMLSAGVLFLTARLLAPFVKPLAWAGLITVFCYPVYGMMYRLTGGRRNLASALTTVLVALALLGPALLILTSLARESRAFYVATSRFVQSAEYRDRVERMVAWPRRALPGGLGDAAARQIEVWSSQASSLSLTAVNEILPLLKPAIGNLPILAVHLVIVFVALFYFLRDGELWLRHLDEVLPLASNVKRLIMAQFGLTIKAVLYGLILTALVQAVLLALGFKFFNVPWPVFWGVVAFFLSLLPMVGPSLLWIPASAYLGFVMGNTTAAVGLFAYGVVIVTIVDVAIRPYIIGERAKLPILLLVLAILGGLMTFGALGLFLGPVLVAVGLAVARIYREMQTGSRRRA